MHASCATKPKLKNATRTRSGRRTTSPPSQHACGKSNAPDYPARSHGGTWQRGKRNRGRGHLNPQSSAPGAKLHCGGQNTRRHTAQVRRTPPQAACSSPETDHWCDATLAEATRPRRLQLAVVKKTRTPVVRKHNVGSGKKDRPEKPATSAYLAPNERMATVT